MQEGIVAIAEFARQNPHVYPAAYLDWIGELEKNGEEKAVILTAREALAAISREYAIRFDIAVKLMQVGEKRNNAALKLEGYRHCFSAKPSMEFV